MNENNILIAEFMELDVLYNTHVRHSTYKTGIVTLMKYDTDWEWLWQVIDKIEDCYTPKSVDTFMPQPFIFKIEGHSAEIIVDNDATQIRELKIHINKKDTTFTRLQLAYNCVIEFIKWYKAAQGK